VPEVKADLLAQNREGRALRLGDWLNLLQQKFPVKAVLPA
jgi:hypothetical protein